MGEQPEITQFQIIHIPLNQLNNKTSSLGSKTLITVCQSGGRSLQAAQFLSDTFGNSKQVYSLKGGITNWKPELFLEGKSKNE